MAGPLSGPPDGCYLEAMKPCVFINLPAATERRHSLETSFAACEHAGWRLERFEALGPADVAHIPGSISPAEKACFASHRAVLGQHLDDEQDLFITEDDALFSRHAFGVVDAILARFKTWDVLFTDTVTSDLVLMVRLAKRWEAMVAKGQFDVQDLSRRAFFGASAYVVRGSSKRALYELLGAETELNEPYDLFLCTLARTDRAKMGACFPYVTTVAAHAETSQIQATSAAIGRTLNAFRRLMYVARDLPALRHEAEQLQADYADDASMVMGGIFAAIASPAFPSDS
jgi:GR25 family glycosyltransferase involved in LPS biosynthesis